MNCVSIFLNQCWLHMRSGATCLQNQNLFTLPSVNFNVWNNPTYIVYIQYINMDKSYIMYRVYISNIFSLMLLCSTNFVVSSCFVCFTLCSWIFLFYVNEYLCHDALTPSCFIRNIVSVNSSNNWKNYFNLNVMLQSLTPFLGILVFVTLI